VGNEIYVKKEAKDSFHYLVHTGSGAQHLDIQWGLEAMFRVKMAIV
jgi:hypothetical protein